MGSFVRLKDCVGSLIYINMDLVFAIHEVRKKGVISINASDGAEYHVKDDFENWKALAPWLSPERKEE